MDVLKNLIGEHGSTLMATLTNSGFTSDQAQTFLPEAAEGIGDAIGGGGISTMLGGGDTGSMMSTIMGKIDIDSIASKAGIDASLARSGITALIPKILAIINANGGGLSSLPGGEGVGGVGGVAGLTGKLFNR